MTGLPGVHPNAGGGQTAAATLNPAIAESRRHLT